jgi:excinuclease ABC subunit A
MEDIPAPAQDIVIAGAREHNLKGVDVRIPRSRLTVITGLSGSGKSSLAFDTLYAEGQRRYVESLSSHARQFLGQMRKPDADRIEGLSPAIAIQQHAMASNPRSTVATATEIHDYLRVLYSVIGQAHCPRCGRPVRRQSADQIVESLMQRPSRTRLTVLAPLGAGARGGYAEALEAARKQGFVRVRVDGEVCEIEEVTAEAARRAGRVEAVVDRLIVTSRIRSRLTDSVELALKRGEGTVVVLQQGEGGAEGGDTVGEPGAESTFSELNACVDCGVRFEELTARHFSFNSPYGACPECTGLGRKLTFDEGLLVPDATVSLQDGALPAWRRGGRRLILYYRGLLRALSKHYGFSLETPFGRLPERIRAIILRGSGSEEVEFGHWRGGVWRRYRKPFEGVIPNLQRRYETTESEATKEGLRRWMNPQPCVACGGTRLRPETRACLVAGKSIADVAALSVRDALALFAAMRLAGREEVSAGEVVREIAQRLRFLADIGLDYLTLDRESATLSGGESQRIRLATQLGTRLVGVLYVLDEPTIGLHPRDNRRLIGMLKALRDLGNTVVVVEHDEEMIREADWVIDLGPGAGALGGEVMFQGAASELPGDARSLTARYLRRPRGELHAVRRKAAGRERLRIVGARENNLKNVDVEIPLGLLVCVTGVSGSGKSTLVDDILRRALFRRLYGSKEPPGRHTRIEGADKVDRAIVIDQSPVGRTPRSNPATYTGAFGDIRKLFAATPSARVRGYGVGRFSFNARGGRCEVCKGDGLLRLEMHFLPDVYVPCEACGGSRYNRETLEVLYGGRNVAQVLALTADQALELFANVPTIRRKLQTLSDVGLGYLQLGQSATTLSGGEAQRVKLSSELGKTSTGKTLYLLDEPTTGLHFADTQRLLQVLLKLRDAGNTVVVIEHNMEMVSGADWVIDLGPEGGEAGGRIVAQGTPEQVSERAESYTGRFLRERLG